MQVFRPFLNKLMHNYIGRESAFQNLPTRFGGFLDKHSYFALEKSENSW